MTRGGGETKIKIKIVERETLTLAIWAAKSFWALHGQGKVSMDFKLCKQLVPMRESGSKYHGRVFHVQSEHSCISFFRLFLALGQHAEESLNLHCGASTGLGADLVE